MHIIYLLKGTQALDSQIKADILITAAYLIQKHERCYYLDERKLGNSCHQLACGEAQMPDISIHFLTDFDALRS